MENIKTQSQLNRMILQSAENKSSLKSTIPSTFNSLEITQEKENGKVLYTNIKSLNSCSLPIFSHTNHLNDSTQQEKYLAIKQYCARKNDAENYPLISYQNFLLIDKLKQSNDLKDLTYKNFLLGISAEKELYSSFITLLMNRNINCSNEEKNKIYSKITYQIFFGTKNVYNFMEPDVVFLSFKSKLFLCLIYDENKIWNLMFINSKMNECNFYLFNKNLEKDIVNCMMFNISQFLYPQNIFKFNIVNYSNLSKNIETVLPFVLMEFISRNRVDFPSNDEDIYYQKILILSEIINKKLLTI